MSLMRTKLSSAHDNRSRQEEMFSYLKLTRFVLDIIQIFWFHNSFQLVSISVKVSVLSIFPTAKQKKKEYSQVLCMENSDGV